MTVGLDDALYRVRPDSVQKPHIGRSTASRVKFIIGESCYAMPLITRGGALDGSTLPTVKL